MSGTTVSNVYKIKPPEGCEWLQPVDKEHYKLFAFDGKPRASSWKPVAVERLKDSGDGRLRWPVDFPWSSACGDLAMTDAARRKIGTDLEKYGEFLPLICDEGKFWAFQVTHFIDALDEHASDLLRASDDPDYILMILKHAFRPERLTADWMFKLPQSRGRGPCYVTDPFINMIDASGLTGLAFKRIWPHS